MRAESNHDTITMASLAGCGMHICTTTLTRCLLGAWLITGLTSQEGAHAAWHERQKEVAILLEEVQSNNNSVSGDQPGLAREIRRNVCLAFGWGEVGEKVAGEATKAGAAVGFPSTETSWCTNMAFV